MSALVAGAIAAPVVGGLLGAYEGGKERRRQDQLMQLALAELAGIDIPDIEQMKLDLMTPEYVGDFDPRLQQLIQAGPSAFEDVQSDPRLDQQQMRALEQVAGVAETGELSESARAAAELARRQAASEAQAKQGQILQEMQARGMGGSGAELVSRQLASEAAADRLSQMGLGITAGEHDRQMQAIMQRAGLAGDIRGQQFGEKARIAEAQDILSRFNTGLQQQREASNVAAQNQAGLRNLEQQQNLAQQRAQILNQQQQYNRALAQQDFDNQMRLGQARSNIYTGQAGTAGQRAGQTAGMWSGIGQGVGSGLAGWGAAQKKQDDDDVSIWG